MGCYWCHHVWLHGFVNSELRALESGVLALGVVGEISQFSMRLNTN